MGFEPKRCILIKAAQALYYKASTGLEPAAFGLLKISPLCHPGTRGICLVLIPKLLLTYWMPKSKLNVLVQFGEKTHTITMNKGSTYEQLVRELMLNPEEVLVFVNGISMPSDEHVTPETVHLVKVVSGG